MKSLQVDRLGALFVVVWTSGYVFGGLAARSIAPLTANFWRFVIAAAVLAVLAGRRRERWPGGGRELWSLAGVGVLLFTVQFGGLYTGMAQGTPAGTTALIACSSSLVVAAVGAALGWDRLTPRRWAGIGLGVLGVVVTLGDRVGRPPTAAALGWTLLGLVGLTAGTLLQGQLRTAAGPAALAATELTAAAAVMAVWAPLSGSLSIPATSTAVFAQAWITLVPGIGAPLLFFALIKQRGATRASSLLFLVPAVTAVAAWPVLGTPISPTALPGMALAGLGLWLARASAPAARPERERTSIAWTVRRPIPRGGWRPASPVPVPISPARLRSTATCSD